MPVDPLGNLLFSEAFDMTAIEVHQNSIDKGFWDEGIKDSDKPLKICLMHSELSEALEAIRKDSKDDKLPQYDGDGVELADCVIRIMDYAAAYGIPLGKIIVEKIEYNAGRAYRHGGKLF